MLIAIDHGNYAVKTPHFSFISGLTEHTVKPPMAEEVLEYNGKYWSLTGQRLPYMRDKTRDDRYFILSLFAIAKELSAAGANTAFEQIDLAVGLPPEHYGMLKERFAQYFRRFGTVNFAYNNRPMSIVIRNVFVYPQAYHQQRLPHGWQENLQGKDNSGTGRRPETRCRAVRLPRS